MAALLAMQLKESCPGITCVAFAPPPSATQRAAELCSLYITSVVADDDMVPRCSAHSLIRLLNEVASCPWRRLLRRDVGALTGTAGGAVEAAKEEEQNDGGNFVDADVGVDAHDNDGTVGETPLPALEDRLFPPGKIVHLYRCLPAGEGDKSSSSNAKPGSPQFMRQVLSDLRAMQERAKEQLERELRLRDAGVDEEESAETEAKEAIVRRDSGVGSDPVLWEAAVVPTSEWFSEIRLSENMTRDHSRRCYYGAIDAVLAGMTE